MPGFIALEISAYLGHVGMVDLLAAQPGPLMQTQRSTLLANALRNAAQNGHLAVMRLLETLGALPCLRLAVGSLYFMFFDTHKQYTREAVVFCDRFNMWVHEFFCE